MNDSTTPLRGEILDFNEVDGIGRIRLETSQVVSFGYQSLRGIETDHDRPVIVRDIREQGALGPSAFDVRDAEFDERDVDDQRAEIADRIDAGERDEHMGWAAVHFDSLPPLTIEDWDALGQSLEEFEHDLEESPRGLGGTVTLNGSTMPVEVVLTSREPAAGYVSVLPSVLLTREYRAKDPQGFPDPWGKGLFARSATRLILALIDAGGQEVELPLAQCRKPAEVFVEQAGDVSREEVRAWEAWIHGGRDPNGNFATFGMEAHALPDVTVEPMPGAPLDCQIEAGLKACKWMVYENRVLGEGQQLETDGPDGPLAWVADPLDVEVVLMPDGQTPRRMKPDHDYGDTTPEEQYFLDELRLDTSDLVACGYLTTPIRHESKGQAIADGLAAKSAFVGLTHGALHLVHARTPATSKPLLENQGVETVGLNHVFGVRADGAAIHLDLGHEVLVFEPKLENKRFPSQEQLIEGLLNLDESAPSLDELRNMRLKEKLKRWWPFAMALVIAFVVLLLSKLEIWL